VNGFLALEDGTVFGGDSVGAPGFAFGEAVFTTAMTGYQELVTDPSYAEQLLCFTAPMVGNYGVAEGRSESKRPHATAVVMREARGPAWTDWLHDHGIVSQVSTREPYVYAGLGRVDLAVVDYGCKRSILRRLAGAGAAVTVYPHDADADTLAAHDGVLLSNGPGDPEPLRDEVARLRELLGRVPILGICLGHQLLGLAAGHETFKLPFGHRGANHPVLERETGRVLVTSQNHGFAVAPTEAREATHVSLYDGTVEGFELPELRARSLQFHPEAGPGPHDAWRFISEWVDEVADAEA
jgi:carbamoyl-phosphate synthase small subunit